MNSCSQFGGFLAPLMIGVAVHRWHSWNLPFHVMAITYLVGAAAWFAIDPEEQIDRASAAAVAYS